MGIIWPAIPPLFGFGIRQHGARLQIFGLVQCAAEIGGHLAITILAHAQFEVTDCRGCGFLGDEVHCAARFCHAKFVASGAFDDLDALDVILVQRFFVGQVRKQGGQFTTEQAVDEAALEAARAGLGLTAQVRLGGADARVDRVDGDSLRGYDAANTLSGLAGNDWIIGGSGIYDLPGITDVREMTLSSRTLANAVIKSSCMPSAKKALWPSTRSSSGFSSQLAGHL